jgi:low temperature requirement protein LtrA
VEGAGVYLTSRHGNWRLNSVAHLTERHGLFIILAIGESVVAIGVGAASQPISTPLLVAAILGMAAAVGLWWLYFDVVSLAAEHRLLEARDQARVDLAVDAYTYGHFPLVAGIVLAALGVEGVLAGQLLFKRRMHNTLSLPRLVTIGVLLAALIVVETTLYSQTDATFVTRSPRHAQPCGCQSGWMSTPGCRVRLTWRLPSAPMQ